MAMCKKTNNKISFWKFWGNEWTYTIFTCVFTIFFSIFIAFNSRINNIVFWFIIGIAIALNIVLITICIKGKSVIKNQAEDDTNKKSKIHTYEIENRLAQAESINTCYMDIDSLLSNFMSAKIYPNPSLSLEPLFLGINKVEEYRPFWQMICDNLIKLINALHFKGSDFGVNLIVKLSNENNTTSYYMPAANYTEKDNRSPLMTRNFTDEDLKKDGKPYHFLEFFNNSQKGIEILIDEKEISLAFVNDDTVRNQYIAIPIKYQKTTIALLQIIAYDDSAIFNIKNKYSGENSPTETTEFKKLKKDIEKYFRIYEQLALIIYVLSLNASKKV